jgi:hypothetical protein
MDAFSNAYDFCMHSLGSLQLEYPPTCIYLPWRSAGKGRQSRVMIFKKIFHESAPFPRESPLSIINRDM